MDKFLKALLEWINESTGLSETAGATLSAVFVALLVWLIQSGVKSLLERRRNLKAARDLKPQFDYQMVKQATQFYIPTQYQNASPTRQDEPGFTHKYVATKPLIPFFIKTAFNERIDGERFYLILADSGMGKTTFMINLYRQYHSFFNRRRKYKMRLFRFSHPDTLDEIKAIEKETAKNTILLLDALDEDPNIVSKDPQITDSEAFQKRVDEIIEATRNFCEVVLTCRTQYFPGQEADPYELKVKRPDEKGYYILNKLYLSPFTKREVNKYLNKKFGYWRFWNRARKKRAARLVSQSRHLVMRPMMLSYIDYLLKDERNLDADYAIYERLIERWLIREAEKRKYLSDRPAFIENLRAVSGKTAIAIYQRWQAEKRAYLTSEEAVTIAKENNIDLRKEEITGQSLLTCDGAGFWKFAHKSIWEFFLARELIENGSINFQQRFNFTGFDMARRFFEEKNPADLVLVEGGRFTRGEGNHSHQVAVHSFCMGKYPVTQEKYAAVMGKNPSHFKGDKNPVESVNWHDAIRYCNQLNQKYGYPNAYDEEGNLLDATGVITKNITQAFGFRLPTEAEWEYAARGGTQSKRYEYSGSNNLKEVGWFDENSNKKTHPVGVLKGNELGLYDMSGNVYEWCYDWYDADYYEACKTKGGAENPIGPASGSSRVLRGGSWNFPSEFCRPAYRINYYPVNRYNFIGFRLVFVP